MGYRCRGSRPRSDRDRATVLQALLGRGYDGTLLSREEAGETVHFVQLGPYLTEERGQQVAREVRAETGLKTIVIVEP